MPIVKIVGIDYRNYSDKKTGEYKTDKVIHYTYKLNGNSVEGVGADNAYVNTEKYPLPLEMGTVVLVEKSDKTGYITNLEMLQIPDKKPEKPQ